MKCFKDHECDTRELYKVKPISELKVLHSENDGKRITYEVEFETCESVWLAYQTEAYEIVAPGGRLISDPQARNRAINAAYARLWLSDNRFQWAGLAAFASKQVGCGLLHATDMVMKIQAEQDAAQRMLDSTQHEDFGYFFRLSYTDGEALRMYQQAASQNPMLTKDVSHSMSVGTTSGEAIRQATREVIHGGQSKVYEYAQSELRYVHEQLALGNTALFLDVYPLHAFYAKRGLKELQQCLNKRQKLTWLRNAGVYWPIPERVLAFGQPFLEITHAFEAIEAGDIEKSVLWLAQHEQKNILQPAMYNNARFVRALTGNQMSFVTGLPKGVAQPVELTLAGQCQRMDIHRTIEFSDSLWADLSDLDDRMAFVMRAADQFHELLNSSSRVLMESAIRNIAGGGGVVR